MSAHPATHAPPVLSILTAGLLFACLLTSPQAAVLAPALERHACRDTLQQLLCDLHTVALAVELAAEQPTAGASRRPQSSNVPRPVAVAGDACVDRRPVLRDALLDLPPPVLG